MKTRTKLMPVLMMIMTLTAAVIPQDGGAMRVSAKKPRARDLGIEPGVFSPGPYNAITDVSGVLVGHSTIREGDSIRTGVTAILPHGGNLFQEKVTGSVFVGNAFGKLAGSTQVIELGRIETPIILTNTLSVGTAVEAVVRYTLDQPGNEEVYSVNALVGETNDRVLNDIRGFHVTHKHVFDAIRSAKSGPVQEGCVGAGTGTQSFGWKGGIGTSSRVLPEKYGGYTVGVISQVSHGGVLTMDGVPVGKELGQYKYAPDTGIRGDSGGEGSGSCMIVVATDAPLDTNNLRRLAARALFGLARTGASYGSGSGDFSIAFTTSQEMRWCYGDKEVRKRDILPHSLVSPLFQAALEATEEAVYNALLKATTTTGMEGRTYEELPVDRVREILKKYGRVKGTFPKVPSFLKNINNVYKRVVPWGTSPYYSRVDPLFSATRMGYLSGSCSSNHGSCYSRSDVPGQPSLPSGPQPGIDLDDQGKIVTPGNTNIQVLISPP